MYYTKRTKLEISGESQPLAGFGALCEKHQNANDRFVRDFVEFLKDEPAEHLLCSP